MLFHHSIAWDASGTQNTKDVDTTLYDITTFPTTPALPAKLPAEPPAALLAIVDKVLAKTARRINWSTWHVWNHTETHDKPQPSEAFGLINAGLPGTANQSSGFGTCVDHAFMVSRDLISALHESKCPDMIAYSHHVKTLSTHNEGQSRHHFGKMQHAKYHALCAVMMEEYVIVLDVSSQFDRMVLPLGQERESLGRRTSSDTRIYNKYRYVSLVNGLAPVLSWQPELPGRIQRNGTMWDEFYEIGYEDAVEKISFRIGQTDNNIEEELPNSKSLNVYGWSSKRPLHLPASEIDGHWYAVVLRIRVDFVDGSLNMTVPNQDFLADADACDPQLLVQLESHLLLLPQSSDAVSVIKLDLKDKSDLSGKITVVREIARLLGLGAHQFEKLIQSLEWAREWSSGKTSLRWNEWGKT